MWPVSRKQQNSDTRYEGCARSRGVQRPVTFPEERSHEANHQGDCRTGDIDNSQPIELRVPIEDSRRNRLRTTQQRQYRESDRERFNFRLGVEVSNYWRARGKCDREYY